MKGRVIAGFLIVTILVFSTIVLLDHVFPGVPVLVKALVAGLVVFVYKVIERSRGASIATGPKVENPADANHDRQT